MPYYPKSRIITNLYTNGGEYVTSNQENYIGYYWKTASGQFYTGKTPQDIPIQRLFLPSRSANSGPITDETEQNKIALYENLKIGYVPLDFDENAEQKELVNNITQNYAYNSIINYSSKEKYIPTYLPNTPTEKDYQLGEFRRYFCIKTNELIYIEISKKTYVKLAKRDPSILYQLYKPFDLPWKLIGKKEDVYKVNKNIVELVMFKKKLPMFNKYLQEDYTKYYKENS